MQGYLSVVLHAHLPFVRHPEHEKFLEENWLFEAITETYIPLLLIFESWQRSGLVARLTLSLTPTLCSMLMDPLLQGRYRRHLAELLDLTEKEIHRTHWEKRFNELALFYHRRLATARDFYESCGGDLVGQFGDCQERGQLEIITSAATHALLPLLNRHPPSLRAQLLVARDHYCECFGCAPRGIWLPECAYAEGLETVLHEAGICWFIVDAHGLLNANPRPRYALFAPILGENGVAAFGRDVDSARQVWSRQEGYPGDPRYRDFYRDVGFDLDYDYTKPYLAASDRRSFTGIKYHRITGAGPEKQVYDRVQALQAVDGHATHFLEARRTQIARLAEILDRPPVLVAPYDAELFGHWWYEGPEFLDYFVRKACYDQDVFTLITPGDYLDRHPTNQVAIPSASSWGEGGYWDVWLNEQNEWIFRHLGGAQQHMTELVSGIPQPDPFQERALKQAARELMLAQASDWPFILRTGTSPGYASKRVKDHLQRFNTLYQQLNNRTLDELYLKDIEGKDNIFPDLNYKYWLA
jgi:1,4-alpha-glucan branching enzyme